MLAFACFLLLTGFVGVRWFPPGEEARTVPLQKTTPKVSQAVRDAGTQHVAFDSKADAADAKSAFAEEVAIPLDPELAAMFDSFRELEWPDFAHPAILERRENGRVFHQVANHLVITADSSEAVQVLKQWADSEQGRTTAHLVAESYLVEWEAAGARAYVETKTRLKSLLGDLAVVEPNWIVRATASQQGERYSQQKADYDRIFAEEGWAIRTDARDIVVAVVDSGIDYTHPDLVTRVRPRPGEIPDTGRDDDGNGFVDDVYGWDFVENTNTPMDRTGHGTHVAGIIGADGTNTLFGTGVAWDVTLLPVRFLDDEGLGTTANQIKALDYARVSGAHIVNASYGGSGYSTAVLSRLWALNDAGIWFVTSAGNDRENIDEHPNYPASYDVPNVISVAAMAGNSFWTQSNRGINTVDIAAPGEDIYSTYLDGGFVRRSGTSMAAAFVSGALALLLAEFPDAAPAEIRSRLIDRSRYFDTLRYRVRSSGGIDLGHALAPGPGRPPTVSVSVSPDSGFQREGWMVDLKASRASSVGTVGQWLRNGEPVSGKTGQLLRISSMAPEDEGEYQYRVEDMFGKAISEPVSVYLRSRIPSVTRSVSGSDFVAGGSMHLSVEAESSEEIFFQWYFNGEPIPGANAPEYIVAEADIADAGQYHVKLFTDYGSVDSRTATVSLLIFDDLYWKPILPFTFEIKKRVGDYYLRNTDEGYLYSMDLLSWRSHPEWVAGLNYSHGEYTLMTATGAIYRGPDMDSLVRWWTGPHPWPRRSDAEVTLVRNERYLVAKYPGYGLHHVYDLRENTFMMGTRPYTSVLVTAADGYFWMTGFGSEIHRSTDGITWEAMAGKTVLPLWEDESTGWTVGNDLSARFSRGLRVRSPSGEWKAVRWPDGHQDAVRASEIHGRFPSGFVTESSARGFMVFAFHEGAGQWIVNERADGDTALPVATSSVIWEDLDYRLYAESSSRPIVRECLVTGKHALLYPGRSLAEDAWLRAQNSSTSSLFSIGNSLFRLEDGEIYAFGPNWDLRRLSGNLAVPKLTRVGVTSSEALFQSVTGNGDRLFRLDLTSRLTEVTSSRPAQASLFVQKGDGFVAMSSLGSETTGLVDWKKVVALSSDGVSWSERGDLPGEAGYLLCYKDMWLAVQSAEEWIRVYRRSSALASWDLVFEARSEVPAADLVSNGHYVVFSAGDSVFRSEDGLYWQEREVVFPWRSDPISIEPQPNPMGWFYVRGVGYASTNGFDWFPVRSYHLTPNFIFGEWAVTDASTPYDGSRRDIRLARIGGGTDIEPVAVAVRETASPFEWTLTVSQRDSWAIAIDRYELFRDGRKRSVAVPDDPVFVVREHEPGTFEYSIQSVYKDGRRVHSDSIWLEHTFAREDCPRLVTDEWADMWGQAQHYRFGSSFYAHTRSQVFRSLDGSEWELISSLPSNVGGSPYEDIHYLPDDSILYFFNRSWQVWSSAIGLRARLDGTNDFFIQPSTTEGSFASFLFEGTLHGLSRSGEIYMFDTDEDWRAIRYLSDFLDIRIDNLNSVEARISVDSGDTLYLIRVGGLNESEPPVVARFLTRDFEEVREVPDLPDYSFHGLWPDADELVYLSTDQRRVLFADEYGEPQGEISFPMPVEKLSLLEGQTVVGESGNGVHAFLGSRTGCVWPIRTGLVPKPTYLRDTTRLGVFGGKGEYYFLALQDFHVGVGGRPEVVYGPLNRVRSRVRLSHQGGLSTGAGVDLSVRAWLAPAGGEGPAVYLGERMADVSDIHPGQARTVDLDWVVPADVGSGDYRLVVRVNADDAIASIHTGGRSAESVVFTYHPDPALVVGESAFGWVEMEHEGTRFPQGSILQLRAHADEGFVFMEWEGLPGNTAADLTLHLDTSYEIRARYLHASLAAAFPDLFPVPGGDWFANEAGLLFAAVTADWSYHYEFGWFALADTSTEGSWLWFPEHGWHFRTRAAEYYFDPSPGQWLAPVDTP